MARRRPRRLPALCLHRVGRDGRRARRCPAPSVRTPRPAAAVTTSTGNATSAPAPVTVTTSDAVVAVAEKASPAVVTITVDSAGSDGFGPLSMPSTGVGSGFVFDASGLILTNHHVIEGDGTDHGHVPGRHRTRRARSSPTTRTEISPSSRSRPRATCRRSRSATRQARGRPARRRHREPARDVLRDRDERHPVGHRPDDRGRLRVQSPHQDDDRPAPDRRRDQRRQQRGPAHGRERRGDRRERGGRRERAGHRLRDPDRRCGRDHGRGPGGPPARRRPRRVGAAPTVRPLATSVLVST